MPFTTILLVAAMLLGWCAAVPAFAQGPDAEWTEAHSLRELPAGVQVLLGVGLAPNEGGIADRGEPFNPGDLTAPNLPLRRFALAMVGSTRVLVALERGGHGYAVQTAEFRRRGPTWEMVRCTGLAEAPRHGTELLDAFAARAALHGEPCSLAGPAPEPASVLRPQPGA
jgi:hypothetical protein